MFVKSFSKDCKEIMKDEKFRPLENYMTAKYSEWKTTDYTPNVELVGSLGSLGDIEIECKALLTEYEVNSEDFTEWTNNYLKKFQDQCNEKR